MCLSAACGLKVLVQCGQGMYDGSGRDGMKGIVRGSSPLYNAAVTYLQLDKWYLWLDWMIVVALSVKRLS